jgi:hypothetical protein
MKTVFYRHRLTQINTVFLMSFRHGLWGHRFLLSQG